MFKITAQGKSILTRCILAAAIGVAASSAQATNVIYADPNDCGHSLDSGRLAALGHSLSNFNPDNDGWANALSGGLGEGVIVVGECQAGFELSGATRTAIQNYVSAGKKLIIIGDHQGSLSFLNPTFGYAANLVYGCKSDDGIAATITAAAAGTIFANGPNVVRNASCTSGLELASLPPSARTLYAGESYYGGGDDRPAAKSTANSPQLDILTPTSLVWTNAYGSGTLAWLGYDFYEGVNETTKDDWYIVLDNALRYTYTAFTGSANLRISFSGSTIPVRGGSTTAVYARLDNYGRDSAVNPVVDINLGNPVTNASIVAPSGWSCAQSGGVQPSSAIQTPASLAFRCQRAGNMSRGGTVNFRINVVTPNSAPSGFVTIDASTSSDSVDPNTSNNQASFKLYVRAGSNSLPVVVAPVY